MLHTRTHKSRMAIMIKQLMPECTSCVARVHSGYAAIVRIGLRVWYRS